MDNLKPDAFGTQQAAVKCSNHPDVDASMRCDGCAETYCRACVVEVDAQNLCSSCKVMVVKDRKGPPPRKSKSGIMCDEARNALICSLVGLSCCCIGIFLHPIAIVLAQKAVQRIDASPELTGKEFARAAQVTSGVGLLANIMNAFVNFLLSEIA